MNLRFPGQYYDQATGLHYNHNRYYAPELGRYLEPDPIGLEGGRNPYSYAGNDPVNNIDPSGLDLLDLSDLQMQNFSLPSFQNFDFKIPDFIINTILRDSRFLTQGEINMSESSPVIMGRIDYTLPIVVNGGYIVGANLPMTPNGNIYYPSDQYRSDFSTASRSQRAEFMHEMTHVMQHQEGVDVWGEGLYLHSKKIGLGILGLIYDPYDYDLPL